MSLEKEVIFLTLLSFIVIFHVADALTTDQYCESTLQCPNTEVLGCCKFPQLFSKSLYTSCKASALKATINGTSALYEDSCFLECVFKAAGIDITKAISGKFIQDALPFTLESPKSIISWGGSANTIADKCNKELGLADNRQRFTTVYREALNKLNPQRPICNLRIAAFWDCVYRNFFKTCYNEFLTFSSNCETLRRWTTSCEFWAKNA